MALGSVRNVRQGSMGEMGYTICDVQLTAGANYTTGGSAFDVAQVPGAHGALLAVVCASGGTTGVNAPTVAWDPVNKKLMCFGTAASASGLTEVAANVDLSGITVRLFCFYSTIG